MSDLGPAWTADPTDKGPCLPDRMHVADAAGVCIFCEQEVGPTKVWPDPPEGMGTEKVTND